MELVELLTTASLSVLFFQGFAAVRLISMQNSDFGAGQ